MASPRQMDYYTNKGIAKIQMNSKMQKIDSTFYNSKKAPNKESGSWSSVMAKTWTNKAKASACCQRRKREELSSGRTVNPNHATYLREEANNPPKTLKK